MALLNAYEVDTAPSSLLRSDVIDARQLPTPPTRVMNTASASLSKKLINCLNLPKIPKPWRSANETLAATMSVARGVFSSHSAVC